MRQASGRTHRTRGHVIQAVGEKPSRESQVGDRKASEMGQARLNDVVLAGDLRAVICSSVSSLHFSRPRFARLQRGSCLDCRNGRFAACAWLAPANAATMDRWRNAYEDFHVKGESNHTLGSSERPVRWRIVVDIAFRGGAACTVWDLTVR